MKHEKPEARRSMLSRHFKLSCVTCALTTFALPSVQAGTFEFGDGIEADYLTTLNYALNTRTESRLTSC